MVNQLINFNNKSKQRKISLFKEKHKSANDSLYNIYIYIYIYI